MGLDGDPEGPGREPVRPIEQEQAAMSPAHPVKELGIKPGMRMLIVAAPTRYIESLFPLPDGAQLAAAEDDPFAFVQLFVTDAADLGSHASKLLTEAGENALVWITFPKIRSKLASELSRDKVRSMKSGRLFGFDPWQNLR